MPTQTRGQHARVKEFSNWLLIDAMRDAEMGAHELAAELGASEEAVARWMGGIAKPKSGYLKQAARILKVNVNDLFE